MKPVINLNDLELETHSEGLYGESCAGISEKIGAKKLGYSLTIVPPGKRVCPYHNHHNNEEMFLILAGTGTLRFGGNEYPLKKDDVVACPPGGREVAHQIINTGAVDLKYFCLSTMLETEVAEYPDSDKVGVFTGTIGSRTLRAMFRSEGAVPYMDREQV